MGSVRVHTTLSMTHSHFIEVGGDSVQVNQPSDVFVVREVPQQSDLTQSPLGQLDLVEYPGHLLYCDGLSRDLVGRRALLSTHAEQARFP